MAGDLDAEQRHDAKRHGGDTAKRGFPVGAKACGVVEIEVSGARIRVEPGVELATLSTVLSALRGSIR
jgi:hypothetical protein